MKVSFDFNRDDIWNYGKHVTFNIAKFKRRLVLNIVMVPIFVIAVGYLKNFTITNYIVYSGGFSALYIYVLFSVLKGKMVKANSGKEGPLGKHIVEINEDGIKEQLPDREVAHSWNEVTIVSEDKKYVYVQWSPTGAHVMPKRAFSNEDAANKFLTKCNEYWNKAKK
jgi:hypothetical protein